MEEIDNLMNMFKIVGNEYSYKKICEFNDEEIKEYNKLLKEFKNINSSNSTTNEKGRALENLATYTIKQHMYLMYIKILERLQMN